MPAFSLINVNIFGLPLVTMLRRLRALARELDRLDVTVACLQEVQEHRYLRLLLKACTSFSYHAFEPFVYAPKGGLVTLARTPITQAAFTLYRDRGPWYSTEWPLHKGILATQFHCGPQTIVVLNTHIYANFLGRWNPGSATAHIQLGQVRQLAEVVHSQPVDALVIVCGDFNFPRDSFLYGELIARGGLTDLLAGDPRPTYRPMSWLVRHYALPIDFVLLRDPGWPELQVHADQILGDKVPMMSGRLGYLTDHVGLKLDLVWNA